MKAFSLEELEKIILKRSIEKDKNSYTSYLIEKGILYSTKKISEEAFEVSISCLMEDKNSLIKESADLIYHLMILWNVKDIKLLDILNELFKRTKQTGIQEKKMRNSNNT